MEITEEFLKQLAEQIILSRTEDIPYDLIAERTTDLLEGSKYDIYYSNEEKIWRKVDDLISKAKVTVEWTYDDASSS